MNCNQYCWDCDKFLRCDKNDIHPTGKLCLNPDQVEIANDTFITSDYEYEQALKVIAAPEGVTMVDGQLIGPPMIKRAKKIISKYEHYLKPPNHENK